MWLPVKQRTATVGPVFNWGKYVYEIPRGWWVLVGAGGCWWVLVDAGGCWGVAGHPPAPLFSPLAPAALGLPHSEGAGLTLLGVKVVSTVSEGFAQGSDLTSPRVY